MSQMCTIFVYTNVYYIYNIDIWYQIHWEQIYRDQIYRNQIYRDRIYRSLQKRCHKCVPYNSYF